jgi:hypothetical protein
MEWKTVYFNHFQILQIPVRISTFMNSKYSRYIMVTLYNIKTDYVQIMDLCLCGVESSCGLHKSFCGLT